MHIAVKKLLVWFDHFGRDLPWRHTHDSYKICISEIMLQQTQVDKVVKFYLQWLKQFPSWKHLARASISDVVHAWAGLGYNRRALMLREIARTIIKTGVPKTQNEWRNLKGIGPYTAAAICVFVFRENTMPIDTNIRRVLGRFFLGVPYPQPARDKSIQALARKTLLKHGRSPDIPQALFDLATDICKKIPDCHRCPLVQQCKASKKFLSGRVRVPKQMIIKPIERKHPGKLFPDRIYRGRILKVLREKRRIRLDAVGLQIDHTFDANNDARWVMEMIERLKKDGFLVIRSGMISLLK